MKTCEYEIKENCIKFINGHSIEFKFNIQKVLKVESTVIILLKIDNGTIYNQNVFGTSTTGDFKWQVAKTDFFFNGDDCSYTDFTINENGQLVLFNWCDTAIIVNIETGVIISKHSNK